MITWLHRKLLRFYPAEFREEFGAEIEQDFRCEVARRGRVALWRTLLDWMASMPREQWDVTLRDLRLALRALARAPLFTLVVVLSLVLGIAATTTVFTFANALLFQSRVDDPARFVGVLRGEGSAEPASWPDYLDYRDRSRSFTHLAAWNVVPVFLGRGRQAESVMAETVSDNYFEMLGVKPLAGRVFASGERRVSCAQEVILSHRLWRRGYGGDPGVVGRQVLLSGVAATIVGIAPEGFEGTLAPVMTDIWVHLESRRLTNPEIFTNRRIRSLAIAGRLKDGVSRAQALADLNGIERQLQREHRYPEGEDRRLHAPQTRGIGIPHIRRRVEMVAGLLGAVAFLILLISCANVANLILARAEGRRPETALRRALGAGSSRLIRAALTESLVLAALGGAAGLLVSIWLVRLLPHLQPPANDLYTYSIAIHPDYRVWLFALAVTLASGLLSGTAPALQAARTDCMQAMRNLDAGGRPRRLGRTALVSLQVALSVILLVASGLFYRSLVRQEGIAPGFSAANGVVVPLNLNLAAYTGNEAKGRRFQQDLKNRALQLPGVQAAALASYLPLNAVAPSIRVRRDPAPPVRAALNLIDPDYLAAMNVRLAAGRNFSAHDGPGSRRVAIIDERLAGRLSPGAAPAEALGRTLRLGEDSDPVQVVGIVVSDQRRSLTEVPQPAVFLPLAQRYSAMLYLVVRTAPRPEELMLPLARAVEAVDDTVSVRRMRTLETQVRDVLWPIRTGSRMVAWAGMLAALLAIAGLYGVVAYSMARRQREMGIRVALGAAPVDVLRLVARQGLTLTLLGLLLGLPLAAAANTALARILFGIPRFDPVVSAAAAGVWLVIACLACVPPARRAVLHAAAAIRDLG